MWVFYLFAALLTLQAIISLRGGARYLSYFRSETARARPTFTPLASVIVPCRGIDDGLSENLAALFHQEYPAYEIIFVIDSETDEASAVIDGVRKREVTSPHATSRVVIAGEAIDCGQKVHNLRAGVNESDPRSDVLVFVDSDARPRPTWLRALISPLAKERTGASTGYRWFLPTAGGFASSLRAVWNASIASALGSNEQDNFCWGGSTAIRREIFDQAHIIDEWNGAASDDFVMTRALQRANLPIHFEPACLTVSHDDCTVRELVEFSIRQLTITRVYAPHLWLIVLFSNPLFVLIFFGGIALVITRAALGLSYILPLVLVTSIYVLGTLKSYLRLRAVGIALSDHGRELRRDAAAHLILWPVASALYLVNAVAALISRRITWRGISYELKSPHETVIMKRQNEEGKRKKE